MKAARAFFPFCALLLVLGAAAVMPPKDDADVERIHANAVRIEAAKAELRQRIADKWPGYEQDDRLNFPVAMSDTPHH